MLESDELHVFNSLPFKAYGILDTDFLRKSKAQINLELNLKYDNEEFSLPIFDESNFNNFLLILARSESFITLYLFKSILGGRLRRERERNS